MPPTHATVVRFFNVFFDARPGPLLGLPNWCVVRPQEGSWSQHVRFRTPTWSPQTSRNRVCWPSKRLLKLVFCKNSRKCFRNHAGQCFVVLGRPNMASETDPKSLENRSQEPSMLRSFFETSSNRSRSAPGGILGKTVHIKST